eukprot:TRINITY_DN2737_c0_g1_i13.p1 TRINITY_DN2737_c0_g1~~TRINITY_DN2737_c0_g1_i13.p1  ORF type:complete len:174 (+),score=6.25 TRINITY_DN2737_c0_g1_i13:56-523(+)
MCIRDRGHDNQQQKEENRTMMFSYTDLERTPNVLVLCNCGRTFIQHEMYFCDHCSLVFCRFCSLPEISSYSCMGCLDTVHSKDAMQNKNKCFKCIACINCRNTLMINVCNDPTSNFNKLTLLIVFDPKNDNPCLTQKVFCLLPALHVGLAINQFS